MLTLRATDRVVTQQVGVYGLDGQVVEPLLAATVGALAQAAGADDGTPQWLGQRPRREQGRQGWS